MKRSYLLFISVLFIIPSVQSFMLEQQDRMTAAQKYFPQACNLIRRPELCACWGEEDYIKAMIILFGERPGSDSFGIVLTLKLHDKEEKIFISDLAIDLLMKTWKLYEYDAFWNVIHEFPYIKKRLNRVHTALHEELRNNRIPRKVRQRICGAQREVLQLVSFDDLEKLQQKESLYRINSGLDNWITKFKSTFDAAWKSELQAVEDKNDWNHAISFMVDVIEKDPSDVHAYIMLEYVIYKMELQYPDKKDSYKSLKKCYRKEAKNRFPSKNLHDDSLYGMYLDIIKAVAKGHDVDCNFCSH